MPRVSVIMASYNHEQFVGRAIQSVLDQTFQDFEIIVTDDASPDGTADVIRSFQDPRISVEQFERNRQDSARNRCLARATGDYISILNSDDEFHPRKLEEQVAWLDAHPETGVVFTLVRMINEDGDDHPSHRDGSGFTSTNRSRFEWLRYFFDTGNCLCIPSAMIRNDILKETGGFDPLLAQMADLDMWIQAALRAELHILPVELTKMRLLDGEANASGRRPETIRRRLHEYYHLLNHYRSPLGISQLAHVFPDLAGRIQDQPASVAAYELARYAMELPTSHHRLFGVELVRELLADPHQRAEIAAHTPEAPIAEFMRRVGKISLMTAGQEQSIELHWTTEDSPDSSQKSESLIPIDFRHTARLAYPGSSGDRLQLRIDPGHQPGIVSLHSVTVRDRENREVVQTLSGRELGRSAVIRGTACPLPRRGQLRLLSTGRDPQIHLAPIYTRCDRPLEIEVDMKISTDLAPLARRVARLHSMRQAIRLRASLVKKWLKRGMAFIWPSVIQQ